MERHTKSGAEPEVRMKYRPPRLFHQFFRWFCHRDLLPSIEGDLMELYEKRNHQYGRRRANLRFITDVLLLFRPGIIRPVVVIKNSNPGSMWKNYLTIGWRNIARNRGYSMINIGGLTIGMAVALFLGLWVYDEISFDRYHPHYDRTGRIIQNLDNNGQMVTWRNLPYPLADELRQHYGEDFEALAMSSGIGHNVVTVGDQSSDKEGDYIEPAGPDVLGVTMIRGSKDALQDPTSILLSKSTAIALFGDVDPMGQALRVDGMDLKVAGVYADMPANSSFSRLGFMASWKAFFDANGLKNMPVPWRPNGFSIWVRLRPGAEPAQVSEKIKDAIQRNLDAQLALKKQRPFILPMRDWHLRSEFKNGINVGGSIRYVWLFGLTGVFVLLLACINFMNLSTAQSERRSREVGIRKSMGSMRTQLVGQFFFESVMIAGVSLCGALIIVQLLLPIFNQLVNKQIFIPWSNPLFLLIALGLATLTGLLAGAYPALLLSSFQPVNALKGAFKAGRFAGLPRKVLVVVQFSVSVSLIIGTWIVTEQINFGKHRSVGYTREGLVGIPMATGKLREHIDAFRQEVTASGEIVSIARATNPATATGSSSSMFNWEGKDPALSVDFPFTRVSYDYGATLGWKFIAGRDFSRDFPSDTIALVINEAAAKFLGFKEPVGGTVRWYDQPFTIIGVIEDMVLDSPYDPVRPMVFSLTQNSGYMIMARIRPGASTTDALTVLERTYEKYAPGDPFNYSFIDQDYAAKFGDEEKVFRLAGILSLLAIFISCLGIFGLASFVVERRTKEVGVRKVMGASIGSLWQLLSSDFVVLVLISFGIAFPAAWYFASDWLANYSYRVEIGWWIYAASGIVAIAITLATVSYHTLKAAGANPVKSLRTE